MDKIDDLTNGVIRMWFTYKLNIKSESLKKIVRETTANALRKRLRYRYG